MSLLMPEYLLNLTFRASLAQHCGKKADSSHCHGPQGALTLGREESLMVFTPWTRVSLVILFWHGAGRAPPLSHVPGVPVLETLVFYLYPLPSLDPLLVCQVMPRRAAWYPFALLSCPLVLVSRPLPPSPFPVCSCKMWGKTSKSLQETSSPVRAINNKPGELHGFQNILHSFQNSPIK